MFIILIAGRASRNNKLTDKTIISDLKVKVSIIQRQLYLIKNPIKLNFCKLYFIYDSTINKLYSLFDVCVIMVEGLIN